jgi:hypothetical protein
MALRPMQGEALFQRFSDILIEPATQLPQASAFSGNLTPASFLKWSSTNLHGGFGEDVHAADLGGHPKFWAVLLNPDDRGLAAHPALLAGGEFGGENQDQFHVASLFHAGLGVEKDSVGADVASVRGLVDSMSGAHAGGNAGGDSRSGAALGVGFHAVK